MTDTRPATRYRFGVFEVESSTGELRRKGVRIKLHSQPLQVLLMLLERPGAVLTREEISRELWPDGTFVDYEHGVNSAVNRLREALGDKASSPRFVETLARKGYRFVAPVERVVEVANASLAVAEESRPVVDDRGLLERAFAGPMDLPRSSHGVVQTLFLMLQVMYVGFYVGALANLAEINDLLSGMPYATQVFGAMVVTAAVLIPVRVFLVCAVLFHAPRLKDTYRKLWWFLLPLDMVWALAPFLLLHHMNFGLALACMTPLIYAPFAQRSLVLMGAGQRVSS